MATAAIPPGLVPRPIRRVEYEKMGELGIFENEPVELLDGTIIQTSARTPAQAHSITMLTESLILSLRDRAFVRVNSSFAASDYSMPEPAIAVLPRPRNRDTYPSEAFLIIEVADGSLATDLGTKARLYAECGVPEYWVVDLRNSIVEVRTDTISGRYTRVTPYRFGERLRLLAFPDVEIAVQVG